MKKLLSFAVAIAVGVLLSSNSFADITDNSGAGFAFPDDDVLGASTSIVIGADEVISDLSVTIRTAAHTWVGDLVVTISDGTTTADLMFRTGQLAGAGAGDSSDLGGTYTFANGGASWWDAAAAAGGAEAIPDGTYAATTADGAAVDLAALFGGSSTAATWTLFVSDNAGGDTGDIAGWGISFTSSAIPEPGSIALLGVLGVACVIRRRR